MSMRYISWVIGVLSLLAAAAACAGNSKEGPSACLALSGFADSDKDASPAIALCLSQLPRGASLGLLPGRYHLHTTLTIARPVTIETRTTSTSPTCRKGEISNCALLIIGKIEPQPALGTMPVEITSANVQLRSIAIVGRADRGSEWEKRTCLDERVRPLGGLVRVRGSDFRMESVLLKGASCYTAMEIVPQAKRPVLRKNTIGPNGRHGGQMWADGVTIHDTNGAVIEDNLFQDNTDVQLIFGGCRGCIIRANTFRHSQEFTHASFAELMLHAWPNTSGDFSASTTSRNDIDCGPARRCGFGIMIGGEPWYPAKTFGGSVSDNRVTNALLGVNVDRLTGNMIIARNTVRDSGGPSRSDCGMTMWPSVNISPSSIRFARTDVKMPASMDTTKCLLLEEE